MPRRRRSSGSLTYWISGPPSRAREQGARRVSLALFSGELLKRSPVSASSRPAIGVLCP